MTVGVGMVGWRWWQAGGGERPPSNPEAGHSQQLTADSLQLTARGPHLLSPQFTALNPQITAHSSQLVGHNTPPPFKKKPNTITCFLFSNFFYSRVTTTPPTAPPRSYVIIHFQNFLVFWPGCPVRGFLLSKPRLFTLMEFSRFCTVTIAYTFSVMKMISNH